MGEENFSKEKSSSNLHVVMFPFFAFGHISPFVQLSNKLSSHGVTISFFSAQANAHRIKSMLNPSAAAAAQVIPLTLPPVEGLPPGLESTADLSPAQSELLKVALDRMQPQVKALLSQLKPHFVIFDFAQEWLPPLARELGIKTVFYSVFVALSTAYLTVPARLPEPKRSPTLDELRKPPPGFPQTSITSVKSFEARDFLYMFKSFHGGATVYDRVLKGLTDSDVILAKTCTEMEGPYVDYVKRQFQKPVLLVGPVVPEPPSEPLEEKWAKWLAHFKPKSVIYCSFGSETFLSDVQMEELLLALDSTGLPFFLVLNFPTKAVDISEELKRFLPDTAGFLERVKDKSVIHTGWVQQQQILAHESVGYYVFHAGFSSVIEAIVNDCQMVMLPIRGDQLLNSKLVGGDLESGVEVNRRDEDGHFGRDDIKRAVESVMVGIDGEPAKSIRSNQRKWKEFLLNDEIQKKFIDDLVQELKKMVHL